MPATTDRLLTVRPFILLIIASLLAFSAASAPIPDKAQLQQELEQAKADKNTSTQSGRILSLENALNALAERQTSLERIKLYQQVIDNFPALSRELRQRIASQEDAAKPASSNLSMTGLDQEILQISSQLLEESRQAQQEQERAREISDSLSQLPQQQAEARRALSDSERRLQGKAVFTSPAGLAQNYALQAEAAAQKAKVDELELAQLSANNRQELARMRAKMHQQKAAQLDSYLQSLRNQLNNQRQQEAELALARTEQLAENNNDLPPAITDLFRANRTLSTELNQQAQQLDQTISQQRRITDQTIKIRQALGTLREQSQWSGASQPLSEALRAQIARLPEMPKVQQLNNEIGQLRLQRLRYEDQLNQQQAQPPGGKSLTASQSAILDAQLKTQRELLNSLISGCDTLILEVTKLKVENSQLEDVLKEMKEATHRYLFWAADVSPVGLHFPLALVHDLTRLLSLDTLGQLGSALLLMVTNRETILPVFGAILLVGLSISSRRHYQAFLERAAGRVGKVTQDHFRLTLRTVFWSILIALPVPVLWATLGYGLQHAWPWPIAVAIGDGVTATLPLLWAFMISATFARPHGLFIVHFRWPSLRVARAMRYYSLTVGFIIPLIMLLIAFDNLDDRQFYATLGRLCFILICGALSLVTISLKRAGIPLYLDKEGNGGNLVNRILWNLLIFVPLLAAFASCIGYLATSQALLARLETSVGIWFLLLVIYHIICRWMLIQRRRIAFERARQRRAEIVASRARGGEEEHAADGVELEEPVIDLDALSIQSLRLVRSLLTLVALISVIVLWSEIHSAFAFLENITLWEVNTTVQGMETLQPVTLGAVLIAILIFIITAQLVRNLPALLELTLLQRINLTPGTGYAITTLTKYLLLLIGGLFGFSMLGIEWAKLQWLVAALGVGLGFGLQEIFANFISGLIILFEKPVRIGDTVTIRDLTGSVTRINTRATTITDWDRKEIIVPNKAFITEQFVNWSLSDSVTRVVLTIPAPADADSEKVARVLKQAAARCSYALETPAPEAWLVDLQQGIQLFELRIHAAEMGHRMPMRHELHQLILLGFRENGIELPFPPFQMRMERVGKTKHTSSGISSARKYRSGGAESDLLPDSVQIFSNDPPGKPAPH